MNITELRNKINDLNLLDRYDGIYSYSISTKIKNNIDTGELCVRFEVQEKKTIEALDIDQLIPDTLIEYSINIPTDVVRANKPVRLGSISTTNTDQPNYYHPNGSNSYTDPYNNLIKRRPLIGGTSSINIGGSDATLGLIVKDSTDGSIVLLSNNHVYASSQLLGADATKGEFYNTLQLNARQPGSNDYNMYGNVDPSLDYVGKLKRCVPITLPPLKSNVDCAIVQLADYNLIDNSSKGVVDFKFQGPYKFATTNEIDSLMDSTSPNYKSPIFRSGRRLGALGYPGNSNTLTFDRPQFTSEIKLVPISDISSIKYVTTPTTAGKPRPSLIIQSGLKTYFSGYRYNERHDYNFVPASTEAFNYIGDFHLFTIGNDRSNFAASIGLSSNNKLVYYGFPTDGAINITGKKYKNFPAQLSNYDDLKKIILVNGGTVILHKGTKLYTYNNSANGTHVTLGYGVSGTNGSANWYQLGGDWDYVKAVDNGFVALSGNNIFYSVIGDPDGFFTPSAIYLTNSCFDLSANRSDWGSYSKIYLADNASICSTFYGLSSDNQSLFRVGIDSDTNIATKTKLNGIWSPDIKILHSNTPMLLSGNKLYTSYLNVNESDNTYSPATNFFINAYPNFSEQFNLVSGVNVQDIEGYARLHSIEMITPDTRCESLVFLSAGNWYMGGGNTSDVFGAGMSIDNDDMVVTSLGYNSSIQYAAVEENSTITDSFTINSKNNYFPGGDGGDSGTAIFALLSSNIPALSTWKCIGLLYGGYTYVDDRSPGICCRIDNVVKQLKIEPWDGVKPITKSNINNIQYNTTIARLSTVTLSGREFYNIGLVDPTNPTPTNPNPNTTSTTTTTTTVSPVLDHLFTASSVPINITSTSTEFKYSINLIPDITTTTTTTPTPTVAPTPTVGTKLIFNDPAINGSITNSNDFNWYNFIPSDTGVYRIRTYSDVDLIMDMYTDSTTSVPVTTDDDYANNNSTTLRQPGFDVTLYKNHVYYFKVAGFSSATGSYTIDVRTGTTTTTTTTTTPVPTQLNNITLTVGMNYNFNITAGSGNMPFAIRNELNDTTTPITLGSIYNNNIVNGIINKTIMFTPTSIGTLYYVNPADVTKNGTITIVK